MELTKEQLEIIQQMILHANWGGAMLEKACELKACIEAALKEDGGKS